MYNIIIFVPKAGTLPYLMVVLNSNSTSSCSRLRDIRGSQIYIRGPCTPPSGKFDTPQLAYTSSFSFVAPLTCHLRRALCIIGFALKGPSKWGFGEILGVWAKIFGGKVHPSRHLWSRSDAPCSSILYGYSHLPKVKIFENIFPDSSTGNGTTFRGQIC